MFEVKFGSHYKTKKEIIFYSLFKLALLTLGLGVLFFALIASKYKMKLGVSEFNNVDWYFIYFLSALFSIFFPFGVMFRIRNHFYKRFVFGDSRVTIIFKDKVINEVSLTDLKWFTLQGKKINLFLKNGKFLRDAIPLGDLNVEDLERTKDYLLAHKVSQENSPYYGKQ